MMSVCSIYAEGAPSLRFLQGRVTMQPTELLWLCDPVAHAFQVPALCQVRKGRGTHCVYGASKVKSLGHPPTVCTHLTGWAESSNAVLAAIMPAHGRRDERAVVS